MSSLSLENLRASYAARRSDIRQRLSEFKKVFDESDDRVFAELAFCLCTPQSKATQCWKAVDSLVKNNLLYRGTQQQIKPFLNTVRFNENKSGYIVGARDKFTEGGRIAIKEKLRSLGGPEEMRGWLIENIKGLGPKEASHFLRNIGFGDSLAILDSHIMKNLVKFGVIDGMPKSLTGKRYFDIERKMKAFADEVGIPFAELDLLLWSEETGMIFK